MKDAGLLDEVFPETENKEPVEKVDVATTGAKPKVAPPLKLDGSMKPPEPKGPPPGMAGFLKTQAAASSKHAFQLPTAPGPGPNPTSSQGRLVVHPEEMRKFLYGSQDQSRSSASSSSTTQPVLGNNSEILFDQIVSICFSMGMM